MLPEDREYERQHPRDDYAPGDVWLVCGECGASFPVARAEARALPAGALCDACCARRNDEMRDQIEPTTR